MANKNISKVVYGGKTLIDLTADTVTADKVLKNYTTHDKSGALITGTCTFNADTSDATAAVAEILFGKTAYVNGVKLTGTMKNNGAVTGTISTKAESKTATPSTSQQTILPDSAKGYNYISQVVIEAIPYNESDNPQGGVTVTIG